MIQETCLEIEVLSERHERERLERYARRHKIQQIDELLNEFEMLNLADEVAVPERLRARASRIIVDEQHALALRPPEEIRIVEWMDGLYDVQDSLMLTVEDDIE